MQAGDPDDERPDALQATEAVALAEAGAVKKTAPRADALDRLPSIEPQFNRAH